MPAFSRGCFLRLQLPLRQLRQLQPLPSFPKCYQARSFSASVLRAAKPTRTSPAIKSSFPKDKPSYAPLKASPNKTSVHQTYQTTLALKSHPTPLYEAPSHTLFILTSYGGAFFFLVYSGYACYTYFDAPAGIPVYVPYAFGGAGFLMAAFAGWLMLGPAKIIRSITAVPKRLGASAGKSAKGPRIASQGTAPELELEVELRKMFPMPFFPARKIYCKPREFIVSEALARPPPALSPAEMREMKMAEEEDRQRLLEYERSHILTAPFRHANKAFFELFQSMRRAWTREGFHRVEIKGKFYKFDTTGGWALDNGRALIRLAAVKRKP
ncbi:uncharacterized protein BP5553_00463 [Venustampulla echinocandica]|uniref:Uncharacterized protein n=1 Tax=Venustampulla echinocandica TaxID=2656787 RepID=A0A370TY79_9HELO|nr:uncharacterized protein BP5553_00463 [Venustampulla echinocandica]RDL40484.1 hypothetical protein BP5553_00463 [Venustampulla echinocandica]